MANWEALILRGARADQPAAGIAGRLYFVTDEYTWEQDTGSTWATNALTAALLAYTPAVLANWDYGSDPGDVADALDQLADRVASIEAGGIGGTSSILQISDETLAGDGAFANVTIPAGYEEVWVRARVRTADAGATDRVGLRLGTGGSLDTGNNYVFTVQWQGAAAGGTNSAAASSISGPVTAANGSTANYFGDCEWVILSPGDTSQWKNVRATGGYVDATGHRVGHGSGVWKNTGAINILNIVGISTATFKAGSRLQVLGINYG